MANVNLALDEIISKTRRPPLQRRFGKRPPPRVDEPLSQPNRSGRGRRNSFGGGKRFARNENEDVVWINIANLPDTVLTQDLQVVTV